MCNLVGIFVLGTCMAIICEEDGIGCVLTHITTIFGYLCQLWLRTV